MSLLSVTCNSRSIEFVKPPVMVYEPTLDAPEFFGSEVTYDLEAFKAGCDVVDKVYTRDLFKRD